MKSLILMFPLLTLSLSSWADCELTSSQQSVSYGRVSAAERQLAKENALNLPEKKIVINVLCDEPKRIRLMIGSVLPGSENFLLGDGGEMKVFASDALLDDRPVRIAAIQHGEAMPASTGQERQQVTLNQGLAFINGTEARGKTASVTLTVQSQLKPKTITERTTWRGNLNITLETQ